MAKSKLSSHLRVVVSSMHGEPSETLQRKVYIADINVIFLWSSEVRTRLSRLKTLLREIFEKINIEICIPMGHS